MLQDEFQRALAKLVREEAIVEEVVEAGKVSARQLEAEAEKKLEAAEAVAMANAADWDQVRPAARRTDRKKPFV